MTSFMEFLFLFVAYLFHFKEKYVEAIHELLITKFLIYYQPASSSVPVHSQIYD